jgi:predicted MFS family arabinose efflux permease
VALLLATGAGLAVASLYYNQPMLPAIARDVHTGESTVGAVPMLTQLGYAAGILLLSPLGDRFDRRRVVLAKALLLTVALLASAWAPGLGTLLAASVFLGMAATLAQDFVPAAVSLAPAHRRGKVVGTVMTGLLLGILLSRLVSGFIAQWAGWRAMFELAAGAVLLLAAGAWFAMPAFEPTTRLGYRALLASMPRLWRAHALLRRAAAAQALLSIAFSAFWSTLALWLHARYGLDSGAAGAFGLAGAAGAVAAPLAGRLADARGARAVAVLGAAVAAVSFAALGILDILPVSLQLALLAVSAIGFDFGVQAALIAHQSTVYGIDPAARSRLNALLYTAIFGGMALGSLLGSVVLARWGWTGVVVISCCSAVGAMALRWRR